MYSSFDTWADTNTNPVQIDNPWDDNALPNFKTVSLGPVDPTQESEDRDYDRSRSLMDWKRHQDEQLGMDNFEKRWEPIENPEYFRKQEDLRKQLDEDVRQQYNTPSRWDQEYRWEPIREQLRPNEQQPVNEFPGRMVDRGLTDISAQSKNPNVLDTMSKMSEIRREELPVPIEEGNIKDLDTRPMIDLKDGGRGTIRSISIGAVDSTGKEKEFLIPTIVNGKELSEDEAVKHFYETGEHLGVFNTPDEATAYGKALSERQGQTRFPTEISDQSKSLVEDVEGESYDPEKWTRAFVRDGKLVFDDTPHRHPDFDINKFTEEVRTAAGPDTNLVNKKDFQSRMKRFMTVVDKMQAGEAVTTGELTDAIVRMTEIESFKVVREFLKRFTGEPPYSETPKLPVNFTENFPTDVSSQSRKDTAPGYIFSKTQVKDMIFNEAQQRNIDPEIAFRVSKAEGFENYSSQITEKKTGRKEPSYGPFQLYMGGGLGNVFQKETGLDPRDPSTVPEQVKFVMNHVAKQGWSQFHGAAKVGIGNKDGIGPNARAVGFTPGPAAGTSPVITSAQYSTAPGDVNTGTVTESSEIDKIAFSKIPIAQIALPQSQAVEKRTPELEEEQNKEVIAALFGGEVSKRLSGDKESIKDAGELVQRLAASEGGQVLTNLTERLNKIAELAKGFQMLIEDKLKS